MVEVISNRQIIQTGGYAIFYVGHSPEYLNAIVWAWWHMN